MCIDAEMKQDEIIDRLRKKKSSNTQGLQHTATPTLPSMSMDPSSHHDSDISISPQTQEIINNMLENMDTSDLLVSLHPSAPPAFQMTQPDPYPPECQNMVTEEHQQTHSMDPRFHPKLNCDEKMQSVQSKNTDGICALDKMLENVKIKNEDERSIMQDKPSAPELSLVQHEENEDNEYYKASVTEMANKFTSLSVTPPVPTTKKARNFIRYGNFVSILERKHFFSV